MILEDLVGPHNLGGVDFDTEQVETWGGHFEPCGVCRFMLDGVVYVAMEDPEDGYRSSMRELTITTSPIKNAFGPILVTGRMQPDSKFEKNNVLELIDAATDKVVLSVGTANTDDYYPRFVSDFQPEHMAINAQLRNETALPNE
jgi:hypothetical protein